MDQGYINHVGIVLDMSASMSPIQSQAVTVVEQQIRSLAQRSSEMNQETRLTIYTFNTKVNVLAYDADALRVEQRVQAIKQSYIPEGSTALIDGTMQAIEDMQKSATLYGDHAFLLFVITDGEENASQKWSVPSLRDTLNKLDDNWSVGVMVPNKRGEHNAQYFGFLDDNIAIWDTSTRGMLEVGNKIQKVTQDFMQARTQGVRSIKGIFTFDPQKLQADVIHGTLREISPKDYKVYGVPSEEAISSFVSRETGQPYKIGTAFYELMKSEEIQPQKQLAVWEKKSAKLYGGANARKILGLPNSYVKVRPADHPDFDIFVQSTSVNRKLIPNQRVIVTT